MSVERESVSTANTSITQRIVERVATAKSTSALQLAPLYTVVDPDALENLFSGSVSQGRIEFEYEGCLVRVDADGDLTVTD